ncbi:MAG: hypothetical protein NTY93_00765 [Candidatus Kaiserbacteria bacterium]|nr:hypothetical protein [Candidatus Kaiserbacteria bacterium]
MENKRKGNSIAKEVTNLVGAKFEEQIMVALFNAEAATLDECWATYHATKDNSVERALVLARIEKLLLTRLENVRTIDECLVIWHDAPSDSVPQAKALTKAVNLASTVSQLKYCLDYAKPHSEQAYVCIRKIAKLLKER